MRYSQLFIQTLKEIPKDAEILSHQVMVRSGLIRKVASGIYNYTPLGLKVLRKFEAIVREEMNGIGAQEILMPMVIPGALWEESGRWDKYGRELLRLKDRHDKSFCLGPTHEEVVTDLVRSYVKSYRQLPIHLYQIQTKFRDEIRPRFGLMRGREFIMKDAYSFHKNWEELDETYTQVIGAYLRIFKRAGLDVKKVKADNGAMGGDQSTEFMVTASAGEDAILDCPHCDYAANTETLGNAPQTAQNCPDCEKNGKQSPLQEIRGIEVGHVFKLGTTYSNAMKADFLDEKGQATPMIMGCYGIGIGRTVAAAIEQIGTQSTMVWPLALAPFEVVIIQTSTDDEAIVSTAKNLYESLKKSGLDVLLDDRTDSVGAKFKDTELIGIPLQVVVGKSWISEEKLEVKDRRTQEVSHLNLSQTETFLRERVHGA